MQKIHWTKLYGSSVNKMDSQHQWMIELTNRLLTVLEKNQSSEAISRSFKSLIEYSKQHFAYEEELMQRAGYPDFRKHKALHDHHLHEFAKEIAKLNSDVQFDLHAFREFLKSWLLNHILHADKEFAAYLLTNAPGMANSVENAENPATTSDSTS